MSANKYAIWWLAPEDFHGFEPHQEKNPLKIEDYIWEQFCSLCGRAGRGRLWVAKCIKITSLPVSLDDPRWTEKMLRSGGIVIRREHAKNCALWGGDLTTLTLDPL